MELEEEGASEAHLERELQRCAVSLQQGASVEQRQVSTLIIKPEP